MRRALVLAIALSAVLRAHAAPAYRLTGIHVKGSKHFQEADIVRATGLKLGQSATEPMLEEVANRMAESGAFAQVTFQYRTGPGGMTVDFQVEDSPEFLPCRFDNFVWLPAPDLLTELRSRVPFFDGKVSTAGKMTARVADALKQLLADRKIDATVDYRLHQPKLGAAIDSVVFVVEGTHIPVREIFVTGASPFAAPLLQDAIKPLLGGNFYASVVESFTANNLLPVYLRRGYLRASFGEPVARFSDGAVSVTLPVTEGLEYQPVAVRWSGNAALSASDLSGKLHLAPGHPADAVRLAADLEQIGEAYGSRGYLRAAIEPVATYDDAARTVAYDFRVNEGEQYRMGRIEISGIDGDAAGRILAAWRMREGDPYDATYHTRFLRENSGKIPASLSRMRIKTSTQINPDRSVNVLLIFMP
jgi:outer membrane protein insertion porin family